MTKDALPRFSLSLVRASTFSRCVCLAIVAIAGCGTESSGIAISGKVTYLGEPISDAAVIFYPVTGRPVTAPLSEEGQYSTVLLPGEYVVTVNVGRKPPPGYKEGDPLPPPKIVLPPQYTMRATSTLAATVSPDQSGPIDFALE